MNRSKLCRLLGLGSYYTSDLFFPQSHQSYRLEIVAKGSSRVNNFNMF